ncbi:DUF7527 domain-containing protein [Haloprofundus salilacus]|uniref:DUF7527 domain-containing protein n=1 Tax=Haloprofundus salilacus TaxID=2876190 RepID=UPI001CCC8CBE|nr:hypothetical protein [Haloprofundus salilacus]
MNSDVIETVTGWEERPFGDGYAGLSELADAGFTGAVSADMAWAFMVNGRVVGVFEGAIESFENADGTAYAAPDPSLPLLFTMQERGGETRANYYTNETSISEADATLKAGNFTGYIELSEHVLSGDYYVVYHGGKSMSVAFVGNSRTLLTGEEAFKRADDEVGIFEVKAVDVDVVEIPEPEPEPELETDDEDAEQEDVTFSAVGADLDAPEAESVEATDATDATEAETEPAVDETPGGSEATDSLSESTAETGPNDIPANETAPDETNTAARVEAERPSDAPTDTAPGGAPAERPDAAETGDSAAADRAATDDAAEVGGSDPSDEPTTDPLETTGAPASTSANAKPSKAASGAEDPDVFSEEAEWRNAKSIPALDPEETEVAVPSSDDAKRRRRQMQRRRQVARAEQSQDDGAQSRRRQVAREQQTAAQQQSTPENADLEQRLERAVAAKKTAETERQQAVERLSEVETERDEQRERADRLAETVERLEAEVESLEERLAAAETGSDGAASAPERTMGRKEALDGTNLFVRYGTKSGGTLEKAHAGEVDRPEVIENLRLEHHTRFETDDLHVEGESYEEFLEGTVEYGFVKWVVDNLLYEIRDTGNVSAMQDLFDAIPKVDRAELGGDVSVQFIENGEEHREQRTFDVVLRDRMGNPLLVADLNDSRAAASEAMMSSLVQNAGQVAESSESLGAAFLVTTSYFEPEALETAADATGGGLLSRGKRKSLVRLSRKRGFHLCLVETRNGDFHLNVPEL